MTIQLAYQQLLAKLYDVYDHREAANIANLVIEKITGFRKIDRVVNKDLPLTNHQQETLVNYTRQLLQHRPVQHVLNEAWFANLPFYVDENVLIPRAETEELVDWIVKDIRNETSRRADKLCMLDVGTGSGCIPIALKKQLPAHLVTAIDVSEEAIAIASKNAAEHQVKIEFLQNDFLNKSEWNQLAMFDFIISNPPYIKKSEEALMAGNVLRYEPHIALFVPDDNALMFYVAIAEFAQKHLAEKGSIYVEINEALGREVVEIFRSGGFADVELRKDLQGKDRMVRVRKY